jgi:hypothetical protein
MKPIWKGRRILPALVQIVCVLCVNRAQGAINPSLRFSTPPAIRVLLKQDVSQLRVSGWDLSVSVEAGRQSTRFLYSGRRAIELNCRAGKISFRSTSGKKIEADSVRVSSPAGTLFSCSLKGMYCSQSPESGDLLKWCCEW